MTKYQYACKLAGVSEEEARKAKLGIRTLFNIGAKPDDEFVWNRFVRPEKRRVKC